MLADPDIYALIVLFVSPVIAGAEEVADALQRTPAKLQKEKPVLAVVMSADGTPSCCARAARSSPRSRIPSRPPTRSGSAQSAPGGCAGRRKRKSARKGCASRAAYRRRVTFGNDGVWLAADRTRALLEAYGVPVVPERLAANVDDAAAAAGELGFPVVVKTAAAGAHESDAGGVALDLGDEAAVRAAAKRIGCPVPSSRRYPVEPSYWRASSRIPSSGRSSRSGPAESSPS